ncbi:MAG: YraN family protein [Niastella sp.]|nr:YraN family protein [Niastella sp.]
MAKHNHTGKLGETLAVDYFLNQGYLILHKNWRAGHWEVDLIAQKDKVLHFIEVKCRRSLRFGHPEESVSKKKIINLMNAAEAYCQINPSPVRMQFDVLAITLLDQNKPDFFLIEDVYV